MPIDRTSDTFKPGFTKSSRTKISAATAATWNPELPREPALLVPVDLQALVVPPGQPLECARVGLRPWDDLKQGFPPPFADPAVKRSPGVYLHWAMPDGLTQGRAGDDGKLELMPLPNRWLVLRLEPGKKRQLRGWVVESERGLDQPSKLQVWKDKPRKDQKQGDGSRLAPEQLTAVAGGDLASAAVFDSSENRFGIYDDLAGFKFATQPLAYMVVGWYSVPELDPLSRGAGDPSFDELMKRLGWSIDEARLESARAAVAAQNEAIAAAHDLEAPPLTVASTPTVLDVGKESVDVPMTAVPDRALDGAAEVLTKVEPWAPQRSLYHGTLYGVFPDARGPDPRPAATDVKLKLAVGITGAESLSRLIADGLTGDRAQAERLLTAYSYGQLDAFEDPDGVPRIEEELHVRGFVATPGGYKVEQVRAGDPMDAVPEAQDRKKRRREEKRRGREEKSAALEFSTSKYDDAVDEFAEQTKGDVIAPEPEPPRTETVRRGEPRWFEPQDPVLTLQGVNRSLRHGFDGRFEPDERVACRLTGDPVQAVAGVVRGENLLANRIDHGGVPPEAEQLLDEAVLEDPFAADDISDVAAEGLPTNQKDAVRSRIKGERQLMLRSQVVGSDAPVLVSASMKEGVEPSPLAVNVWRQAWVPLYAEWEVDVHSDERLTPERWELGELDYAPRFGSLPQAKHTIRGRSLLDATAALTFSDQVNRFLAEEEALDRSEGGGTIDETTEDALRRIATAAIYTDVLSAAFENVREQLLGYETNTTIVDFGQTPPPPAPTKPPLYVRAGGAQLKRMRVVDAFGRTLELPAAKLAGVLVSESMRPPSGAGWPAGSLYMPPRLLPPSRLLLRFVDADDDAIEATLDQAAGGSGPVAGWLLPDNVDYALEFFDRRGDPVGQLGHEALSGGVTWEGAPGTPGPLGAAPAEKAGSRHVAAMAAAVLQRDAGERALDGQDPGRESPLSALLRVIDTTHWTVDPFGTSGTEFLSTLVGRPIAVVRAALTLEVRDDSEGIAMAPAVSVARAAQFDALSSQVFDVRLGALTRFSDGLLAYFVDDDYRHLYPVHSSVPEQALPAAPHTGYLGPADAGTDAAATAAQPIDQPYVVSDPTVSVRPGQTVRLTLLMDPGSSVHVTSGILPRKSVSLLRDWTAPGLARIAPSFRAGPVLLDPVAAGMPKASPLGEQQLWSHRSTPTTWQDRQIVATTREAALPERPPVAEEGYVRARPEDDR